MKPVPIIIGGCYRTGTSLLRRILDAHSNIHCGPEVKFFKDFFADYLNDELEHVRFFKTVRTLGLNNDELLEIFGTALIACHERAAKKLGKRRWADKNPENALYIEQWHRLLNGRFYFIQMVRHPMDTLTSLNEIGFKKTVPAEFEKKVNIYKEYVGSGLAFSKRHPEISYVIRYEDLVTNTEVVLTDLLHFVGEKFEPVILQSYNDSKRQAGIEDPKVKFAKSIHSTSIGRWKEELTAEQKEIVRKILGDLSKELGYQNT